MEGHPIVTFLRERDLHIHAGKSTILIKNWKKGKRCIKWESSEDVEIV